jgi:hypothetical protein
MIGQRHTSSVLLVIHIRHFRRSSNMANKRQLYERGQEGQPHADTERLI